MKNEYERTYSSLHLRKLKELIEEYSKQDFDVFADFGSHQRPEKIGDYEPDLVVKKGNKIIVIEIVSKPQMAEMKSKLEQFAKYADETKDVRFDIVLTNPRKQKESMDKSEIQRKLLKNIRRSLLVDANAAYKRRQYNAAFYLLYDVLKNLLEEYATLNRVEMREGKRTLRYLNDRLLQNNLIKVEDYSTVKDMVIARNKMVHYGGEKGFEVDKTYLENAKELTKGLTKNLD